MRTLDIAETNDVSGGTFCLLSNLFNCFKMPIISCAPQPQSYCPPAKPTPPASYCPPKQPTTCAPPTKSCYGW